MDVEKDPPDTLSRAVIEHLELEKRALEKELELTHRALNRPIEITSSNQQTLGKIVEYLPQLTHISTMLSYLTSAVQEQAKTGAQISTRLERIAAALETLAEEAEDKP